MGKRHNLAELYMTQKSLTEWLEDINHDDAVGLREEDNEKRERLRVLHDISGLPFDAPTKFLASDVAENTSAHQTFLKEHGDELCALRLIPTDPSLPKLRMRGRSIKDVQEWFREQNIDPSKYRAEYMPHSENTLWSTIFVVNDDGIFGEIIRGRHSQLTQGLYDEENEPFTFSYDFSIWNIEPADDDALTEVQKIVAYLRFRTQQQAAAAEKLGATFTHDYLKGYFETSESPEFGLWFIDYAPKMGELIGAISSPVSSPASIRGQVGAKGCITGEAYVLGPETSVEDFPGGAVLVCAMTTPELVPFMQKASAIVTDQGGILSHAAIVARELQTPCIVGTKVATEVIHTGDIVQTDDSTGAVTILKKKDV
jgi:phosphohistidine swiveling domain-containing protein